MQAHCGDQTTTMRNEMLCSNLMLDGLAELGGSVYVFVPRQGACAISQSHNFRGHVLCSHFEKFILFLVEYQ